MLTASGPRIAGRSLSFRHPDMSAERTVSVGDSLVEPA